MTGSVLSPAGQLLATRPSKDEPGEGVRLCDTEAGREVRRLTPDPEKGHAAGRRVAFASDGRSVVCRPRAG